MPGSIPPPGIPQESTHSISKNTSSAPSSLHKITQQDMEITNLSKDILSAANYEQTSIHLTAEEEEEFSLEDCDIEALLGEIQEEENITQEEVELNQAKIELKQEKLEIKQEKIELKQEKIEVKLEKIELKQEKLDFKQIKSKLELKKTAVVLSHLSESENSDRIFNAQMDYLEDRGAVFIHPDAVTQGFKDKNKFLQHQDKIAFTDHTAEEFILPKRLVKEYNKNPDLYNPLGYKVRIMSEEEEANLSDAVNIIVINIKISLGLSKEKEKEKENKTKEIQEKQDKKEAAPNRERQIESREFERRSEAKMEINRKEERQKQLAILRFTIQQRRIREKKRKAQEQEARKNEKRIENQIIKKSDIEYFEKKVSIIKTNTIHDAFTKDLITNLVKIFKRQHPRSI